MDHATSAVIIIPTSSHIMHHAGSPGIGKSVFFFYVMYRLVKEAQEQGRPLPTIVLHTVTGDVCCFDKDGVRRGTIDDFSDERFQEDA